MGLDMYLTGVMHFDHKCRPQRGPLTVKAMVIDLGYWRKHPNLHGYIVQNFGDGKDNCEDIRLEPDNIRQILEANEKDELPETTGFFFGKSMPEDKEDTRRIFTQALAWYEQEEEDVFWKEVIYRASW